VIVQAFIISSQSASVQKSSELFLKQAKPAASKEQDLELTRNVILKYIGQVEDTAVNVVPEMTLSETNVVSQDQTSSDSETTLRKRDRLARVIQKLKPFQK
jgi:hypothetical protein